jgi:hypothetical protein
MEDAPETPNSQNVACPAVVSIGKNSISPWKSDELVPPRVNDPPGSSSWKFVPRKRVSWNAISGAASCLLEMSACQKGVAPVAEMALNARPMMPETEPVRRPSETDSTATGCEMNQ